MVIRHLLTVVSLALTFYAGGESITHTRELKNDDALTDIFSHNIPSESAIGD